MSELRIKFARRLRALRIEREMTQEDLAQAAGLSTVFVSNIERGINVPSFESLEGLARALDVPVKALFDFADSRASEGRRIRCRG